MTSRSPLVFESRPLLGARDLALFVLGWPLLLVLIDRTTDPATDDGLALAGVFVLGLVGLAFLPTSSTVVVDGEAGLVHERLMWLRWGTSKHSPLDNFEAVLVRRTSEQRSEATGAPGSTFNPIRRWTQHDFVLELVRPAPFHTLSIPLPNGIGLATMADHARAIAARGGWPAFRQGWRPRPGQNLDAWERLSLDVREPLA
jgi:hypothetical protein